MTDTIQHRGPDDEGFLAEGEIGLGMRRLSIIDVAGGHQPILNEDNTLAIVFNGEIYNYRVLMEDLLRRGHTFRTHCDTETILHLYEEYGTNCIDHLRGMFAFAIYDIPQGKLFLARDRLGIKPLYYWAHAGKLLFGSEIKALLACADVARNPNLAAIDAYLSLRYVPGTETLFEGVYKLPAAHWMMWQRGQFELHRYWQPQFGDISPRSDQDYQEEFDALFTEAVRLRLISEVPLGAFLSGGVDSTAIVATMSGLLEKPVETFSVGFDWQGDELEQMRAAAAHLNVNSHEVICQTEHISLLPRLVWHLDEPVGDPIVLPMYLLSRLARQKVTVVLSGEGADETLAGYFPHKVMLWAGHYTRWSPSVLRRGVVTPLAKRLPNRLLNLLFDYPAALGQRGRQKLVDYLNLLDTDQVAAQYLFLISLFDQRDKADFYTPLLQAHPWVPSPTASIAGKSRSYLDEILRLQYDHWLPDDILTKQDKMSMANSIEARVPFMDHKLVEFLLQVPAHLKLRWGQNKHLLRSYLRQKLPPEISKRHKKAFYMPLNQYFKAPALHEMLETCLSESSVKRRGYFRWEQVRSLRQSVEQGEFVYEKQVFSLLMLELWHRIFIDRESGWGVPV